MSPSWETRKPLSMQCFSSLQYNKMCSVWLTCFSRQLGSQKRQSQKGPWDQVETSPPPLQLETFYSRIAHGSQALELPTIIWRGGKPGVESELIFFSPQFLIYFISQKWGTLHRNCFIFSIFKVFPLVNLLSYWLQYWLTLSALSITCG